jgi:GT2 family glycosyltransferase
MKPILVPPPPAAIDPAPRPTFSVIIAAYQAAETIPEAIESAFEQTVRPLEVVVCDDGSTDNLDEVLERYRHQISVIHQDNRGEGAAKNAAARAARGDFVAILDADDVYLRERLEALGTLSSARPDLDILTTDAYLEIDGAFVRTCYGNDWSFEVANQRGAILQRNFIFGLAAIRRARLLSVGGFDETLRYATDWDCWIRLILDGAAAGLVDAPLARYRLHPGSLSAQRAALYRGRAAVLAKAASHPALRDEERAAVRRNLREQQALARLSDAHEALRESRPDARRRALAVVATNGLPLETRLRATAAAVAPRAVGRLLTRKRARLGRPGPAGVLLGPDVEASVPTTRGSARR